MKVQAEELTGRSLDLAVAIALASQRGLDYRRIPLMLAGFGHSYATWQPSVVWHQGGEIIEGERIYVMPGWGSMSPIESWDSRIDSPGDENWCATGPTPLVAAMRCFVLSVLGKEVEVPEELT